MSDNDLGERLRRLGLRVDHAQLAAFLTHVHKSHLGPTETLEQLADLEERSRVAVGEIHAGGGSRDDAKRRRRLQIGADQQDQDRPDHKRGADEDPPARDLVQILVDHVSLPKT